MEPQTTTPPQPKKADFKKPVLKYVKDVQNNKIPACKPLKQAVERWERDLVRKDWEWKFDWDRANRVCQFLTFLPYIDGPKAKEPMVWEPWQLWFAAQLFGWVNKKTGIRRFNRAHLWVAKGAGKTLLGAALALYATFADGEMSAEGFTFASTREQAKLLWQSAKSMMLFAPKLREKMGVEVGQYAIVQESTNSSFKALAAEANAQHGLRPQILCIDELHVVDKELWDVLEQGLTKRVQPILLTTSTAGYDPTSIGFIVFSYCQTILEGKVKADNVLVLTYQSDTDDVAVWDEVVKAHPNLGVSVQEKTLKQLQKKAIDLPTERNNFLTLSMNRWVASRQAWLKMEKWDGCYDPTLKFEDFAGRKAFIGLDMSQRNDLTAKAYVFVDSDNQGRRTYSCFFKCYLPEGSVGQHSAYAAWSQEGHLVLTDGDTIDFAQVEDEIIQDVQSLPQSEVDYDPAFMTQMSQNLMAEGIQVVEVRPTRLNFSPAMKEVEAAVYEGRLRHDGNPAVSWQVGNVTVKPDAAATIYPAKVNGGQKIDAAFALFTAISRAMLEDVGSGGFVFKFV